MQNCGDSDAGKAVIELAMERKVQTISIIEDKPGNPETIGGAEGPWWRYCRSIKLYEDMVWHLFSILL